jgi:hypothetical protein
MEAACHGSGTLTPEWQVRDLGYPADGFTVDWQPRLDLRRSRFHTLLVRA